LKRDMMMGMCVSVSDGLIKTACLLYSWMIQCNVFLSRRIGVTKERLWTELSGTDDTTNLLHT